VKLESKNNLAKELQQIKRVRIKINIKNKNNFLIERCNKKNNNFYKRAKTNKFKIKIMRTELKNIIPSI